MSVIVRHNTVAVGTDAGNGEIGKTEWNEDHAVTLDGALGYTIDGGGDPITTGLAGMGLVVPYACTIQDWTLLADVSGAIKIDIWKDSYANFPPTDADSITNGNEPEIASGVRAQDTDLSNWTTVSVAAGDILFFNVDSCSTITKALLVMKVLRT